MANQLKRRNAKVVKYKKNHFSIGSLLFIMILFYIIFISIHFLRKEHISIYEVTEKQMSDDNSTIGIALREEEVYSANSAGFVGFYNSRDKKVAKGAAIFSLDSTGAFQEYLSEMSKTDEISSEDVDSIRTNIKAFRSDFDYSNYNQVYDFKYSVESDILSLTSDSMISKIQDEISKNNSGASFEVGKANESGVISYWTDGFENTKQNDITEKCFDQTDYNKNALRTADSVSAGDAVCKVVTNEDWDLIIKLDDKQYKKLEDKDSVKIRFCKDDLETTVNYTLFNNSGVNYADLSFKKYLARYLDERYIKIELLLNSAEGLKIPVTSILEKSCYVIPVEYLAQGGESKKEVLSCETTNQDGSKGIKEIDTFAMKDETSVYVDSLLIQPGTYIHKPDTEEKFQVGEMKTLKGVYNVNEGYCQFKEVDVIYENREYCLVKKGTEYGLAVYDHIVINPDKINEHDIIY